MKTLSIKQPWAILIASGIKDIENRTWKTNYRGRIYIHASGTLAFKDFKGLNPSMMKALNDRDIFEEWEYTRSAIIGEVDIVDCVINHPSIWADRSYHNVTSSSLPFSEENEPDYIVYNWVLANTVLYDKPILNVKGKLSLWEYREEEDENG